jgi:hypothetical protein
MNFEYVISLLRLDRACRENNIGIDYSFIANESLIQRARNYLCQDFLDKRECTHLLFLDADIQFQSDDVVRMIKADVPLIGGVYPKKKLDWDRVEKGKKTTPMLEYVVVPKDDAQPIQDIYAPQPVKFVGTGMLLIKRSVLEEMQKNNPDDWFYADGKKYFKFFDCIMKDHVYLSEDYYFCNKWEELGGTVYGAFWTRCTHWGILGYEGNIFAIS